MNEHFERKIKENLSDWGWNCNVDEGKLLLLELMVKHQNKIYNSHTESGFLKSMGVMRQDRFPNFVGREFMMHMLYDHSYLRPPAFEAMKEYRK